MDSHQIDVHEVPGLSIGSDINAQAYVVFCQTRSENVTKSRHLMDIYLMRVHIRISNDEYKTSTDPKSAAK